MDTVLKILSSAGTIVAVLAALFLVQWLLQKREALHGGRRFRNQVIMIGLTTVGLLIVILVAPIGDARRGQLLNLIGIVLMAAIGLSSTTFLGNAMAGVMLRAVRNFRMGDFIRTGEHFGRVSERGLFHTEIQTEHRELTTLPNLYLVTHPVTTIRTSGTMVSANVSLGYDVPRTRVKELLLEAAADAELKDPFVRIMDLGDFSVTYCIVGMLTDVKRLLSVQSKLRGSVMDKLHLGGVEIVSPNFMNTRALEPDKLFIPKRPRKQEREEPQAAPEAVVFDKADEAESLEALRGTHARVIEEISVLQKKIEELPEGPDREKNQGELSILVLRKDRLTKIIAARESKSSDIT